MSLVKNNVLLASDIAALKTRIKNELLRRKYVGPVSDYGSSSYDFKTAPSAGIYVSYDDFFTKTADLLKKINSSSFNSYTQTKNSIIKEFNTLSTALSKLESADYTSSSHGCAASCTGLCSGGCDTDCTGCKGTCKGTCNGTCKGSCSGECTGCTGSCSGGCKGDCIGDCSIVCGGTPCLGGCSGCGGDCSGGCKGGCKGNCGNACTSENVG